MSQPQPKAGPARPQRRFRTPGQKYEAGQPLTREDLKELGDGGPWESDEEFTEWLEALAELRHAS